MYLETKLKLHNDRTMHQCSAISVVRVNSKTVQMSCGSLPKHYGKFLVFIDIFPTYCIQAGSRTLPWEDICVDIKLWSISDVSDETVMLKLFRM